MKIVTQSSGKQSENNLEEILCVYGTERSVIKNMLDKYMYRHYSEVGGPKTECSMALY